ncbi:hypothetical protein E2R51_15160 [Jeotgalibacillus sp. S-D1]|uniref:hypothetical protein n=1 Tax=Jeotgalibacillus sp. S-D1 TaxID=2552189 RepID=UPI001059E1DB|nr:hypothetical protein [Jeotgalibacillus sp. S-D1]TDL31128.1 hypothetical protein E2R51_15160 [Jeotgalibacillus sp. S-D1]
MAFLYDNHHDTTKSEIEINIINCINNEAGVFEAEIVLNSLYRYKTPSFTIQSDDFLQFIERTNEFINSDQEYLHNVMLDPWFDIRLFRNRNTQPATYTMIIVLDAGLFKTDAISTSTGPAICLEVTANSLMSFHRKLSEEIKVVTLSYILGLIDFDR